MIALERRHLLAAGFVAGLAGFVLLRFFDPATSGIFPPCPLHYLTGLYCPGCGSLRALHQLLHGNLHEAWALNPLTVVLLPFLAYGLASEIRLAIHGKRLPEWQLSGRSIYMLFAVIVLFGIARNLPIYPFDLLAPGAMLHL